MFIQQKDRKTHRPMRTKDKRLFDICRLGWTCDKSRKTVGGRCLEDSNTLISSMHIGDNALPGKYEHQVLRDKG